MKQAFIEQGSLEGLVVWNLITLFVDDDDKESTEVTSYATKYQAEQARISFLEDRPLSEPHPVLGTKINLKLISNI